MKLIEGNTYTVHRNTYDSHVPIDAKVVVMKVDDDDSTTKVRWDDDKGSEEGWLNQTDLDPDWIAPQPKFHEGQEVIYMEDDSQMTILSNEGYNCGYTYYAGWVDQLGDKHNEYYIEENLRAANDIVENVILY